MLTFFNSAWVNRDRPVLTKYMKNRKRAKIAGLKTQRTRMVNKLLHTLITKEVPHDRQRL